MVADIGRTRTSGLFAVLTALVMFCPGVLRADQVIHYQDWLKVRYVMATGARGTP